MSDFAPIGSVSQTQRTPSDSTPIAPARAPSDFSRIAREDDQVELSTASRYMNRLRALPLMRSELVTSVREQIARGTYESSAKVDAALEELLSDLNT